MQGVPVSQRALEILPMRRLRAKELPPRANAALRAERNPNEFEGRYPSNNLVQSRQGDVAPRVEPADVRHRRCRWSCVGEERDEMRHRRPSVADDPPERQITAAATASTEVGTDVGHIGDWPQ